ncbi:cysteine hydrolase family protein [Falsibacillus pallidus]|uniref:Nicotinamidase-related amidase n=1 Tax=Falsibacillus pallidus TaxID=493781 RepID=A0A370GSP6_9BACI|nr:cysteine hydrolase family protein [Falsibacillus pallidus]RDI45544.1 nicotinamidase-related amidase [Falsibacillus pallidus]
MKQALLIVDAQQDLIEGSENESCVLNKEKLIDNINLVLKKANDEGIPVVCVRDLDVAEGKGKGFEVHEAIRVPTDAVFFEKKATNSFYGTGLLEYLKEQDVGHLVVMGCKTEYCIDTAVRTATVSGFDVTLVGDAHSTSDSVVLKAEQIIQHHNKVLHGHYNVDHFSMVRNAEEDVFSPLHDNYR